MADAQSLTSPNSLFGYGVTVCLPVALVAGDRTTQYIAAAMAVIFALGFVVTTAGRGEAILVKNIAALDPEEPIKPKQLVDPTPPPHKKDPPGGDGTVDFMTNLGGTFPNKRS